ncbi:hypothetical protein KP509_35G065100 [Ceratopteris richardii]|uniref:CCT domain-containing protein n=1 Tax=Ceratopteris richardii TaxID=49495 RepID=A0A8T2QHV6_CERRI|nr:hypothetical protein KP509_35G065100 [Ceratopteris richardii]
MSAESDLLFPQVDSLMLSDFSSFSDYEEFSSDAFLTNEIDRFSLLDHYDCQEGLKPLSMAELNEFSSLEGIKEEDEEEDVHFSQVGTSKDDVDGNPDNKGDPCLQTGSDVSKGIHNDLNPYNAILHGHGDSLMSMEDSVVQSDTERSWHTSISVFEHESSSNSEMIGRIVPPLPVASGSVETQIQQPSGICRTTKNGIIQLPCIQNDISHQHSSMKAMPTDKLPSLAASIFQINSPCSSSSGSNTNVDGGSLLRAFGHDENGSLSHAGSCGVQPGTSIRQQMGSDAYNHVIVHPMVPDGMIFASMHRSRSSHALGQLRSSGNFSTNLDESCLSSIQMPRSMGHRTASTFAHNQPCSPKPAEGSPATAPIRRVFSTGDLQACNGMRICYGDNNLNHVEHMNGDENCGLFKYACRKTLADSRPRIRGRFARTLDDFGEPLVKENAVSYDDDYDEVETLSGHCGMPPNARSTNIWNAMDIHSTLQHGHQ